jgi:hypothetical protein
MRISGLRLHGIYTLPDGTEVIVGAGRYDRYFLYSLLDWGSGLLTINLPIAFEVGDKGQIITGTGYPTPWTINDLTDLNKDIPKWPGAPIRLSDMRDKGNRIRCW